MDQSLKIIMFSQRQNSSNLTDSASNPDLAEWICRISVAKLLGLSHVSASETPRPQEAEAVIIDALFRHPNEVVEAKTLMQSDDYNNRNPQDWSC